MCVDKRTKNLSLEMPKKTSPSPSPYRKYLPKRFATFAGKPQWKACGKLNTLALRRATKFNRITGDKDQLIKECAVTESDFVYPHGPDQPCLTLCAVCRIHRGEEDYGIGGLRTLCNDCNRMIYQIIGWKEEREEIVKLKKWEQMKTRSGKLAFTRRVGIFSEKKYDRLCNKNELCDRLKIFDSELPINWATCTYISTNLGIGRSFYSTNYVRECSEIEDTSKDSNVKEIVRVSLSGRFINGSKDLYDSLPKTREWLAKDDQVNGFQANDSEGVPLLQLWKNRDV